MLLILLSGKNKEGFILKVGKHIERATWRLWINKKFEPWDEELNLHFHRLYSSGIPDFFLTNKDIIKENVSNPFSREEKEGDKKKAIRMSHLKSPFEIFSIMCVICIAGFTLEILFFTSYQNVNRKYW